MCPFVWVYNLRESVLPSCGIWGSNSASSGLAVGTTVRRHGHDAFHLKELEFLLSMNSSEGECELLHGPWPSNSPFVQLESSMCDLLGPCHVMSPTPSHTVVARSLAGRSVCPELLISPCQHRNPSVFSSVALDSACLNNTSCSMTGPAGAHPAFSKDWFINEMNDLRALSPGPSNLVIMSQGIS